jgi:hypothetical protein
MADADLVEVTNNRNNKVATVARYFLASKHAVMVDLATSCGSE